MLKDGKRRVPERVANDVEQKAAEWLVKIDRDPSLENLAACEEFMAAHPQHRAAFIRLQAGWKRADTLGNMVRREDRADPDFLAPGLRNPPLGGEGKRRMRFWRWFADRWNRTFMRDDGNAR